MFSGDVTGCVLIFGIPVNDGDFAVIGVAFGRDAGRETCSGNRFSSGSGFFGSKIEKGFCSALLVRKFLLSGRF